MEEPEERKPVSLEDIERLYDVVAIGVLVTLEAEEQGVEPDAERLTTEAEERLMGQGSTEWYNDAWRDKLIEVIQERVAESKAKEEG